MDGTITRSRNDRYQETPYDPELPLEYRGRGQQFVVENLVKSQVQRMERASREIRELREELGHPMSAVLPSRTSTQQAADYLSGQSSSKYFPHTRP
ncbi:uncharacterized protein CEXT_247861 [Caerostris extrusa]|uniref:Uncharacterized protein n=1 Tax=Caerostris extrusa TaxID=172846 RepID=A0AAV4M6Y1_CAEEX|nr:uncharacterized protein CEXT_247861 [Caerostris extrusa]